MSLTITLGDDLSARLQQQAEQQRVPAEQLAVDILENSLEMLSLPEVVKQIQATPASSNPVAPATVSLAELLQAAPNDSEFNLADWNRRWAEIEAEQKAVLRANTLAEGRGPG